MVDTDTRLSDTVNRLEKIMRLTSDKKKIVVIIILLVLLIAGIIYYFGKNVSKHAYALITIWSFARRQPMTENIKKKLKKKKHLHVHAQLAKKKREKKKKKKEEKKKRKKKKILYKWEWGGIPYNKIIKGTKRMQFQILFIL